MFSPAGMRAWLKRKRRTQRSGIRVRTPKKKTGGRLGVVRSAVSGKPVGGAVLKFRRKGIDKFTKVRAGSHGRFRVVLRNGVYNLKITRRGYSTDRRKVVVRNGKVERVSMFVSPKLRRGQVPGPVLRYSDRV